MHKEQGVTTVQAEPLHPKTPHPYKAETTQNGVVSLAHSRAAPPIEKSVVKVSASGVNGLDVSCPCILLGTIGDSKGFHLFLGSSHQRLL